ncbi:Uncharacterised protein [Mycobacteroides abscessus subsp. abscessus]|uniref:hypothetical protein n=1 Tax=Gordonia jacobaea TaxID=122202 RepID=UPI0009C64F94|nr:hypothetical protein [Gordonia jacobaea]SLA06745.1 Uncharacterised protein [Mycobacteroides abscessus subsp. abscessus]
MDIPLDHPALHPRADDPSSAFFPTFRLRAERPSGKPVDPNGHVHLFEDDHTDAMSALAAMATQTVGENVVRLRG